MPYSRKKSCEQCRAAKTRCSLALPNCTRCMNRGIACVYKDVTFPSIHRNDTFNRSVLSPVTPASHYDATTANDPPALPFSHETAFDVPAPDDFLDGIFGPPIDYGQFLPETIQPASDSSPDGTSHSQNSPRLYSPTELDTIAQSIAQHNPAFMQFKQSRSIDDMLTRSAVHGILKQWPYMLVDGLHVPPFIHPPCYRKGTRDCEAKGKHCCFTKSLDNCCGIVSMSQAMTSLNFDLLSATGHGEQKRMLNEVRPNALQTSAS